LVWARVKGNVGWQYSNQSTLDLVYERLMHEFNQLEDSEHASINGMIEKCAALALEFHGEMGAEDEINDDPENQSDFAQEDPPDPRASASIDPGEQGGDSDSEQAEIGPFAMVQWSRNCNRSNKNEASWD
jgi:hypothetical protein